MPPRYYIKGYVCMLNCLQAIFYIKLLYVQDFQIVYRAMLRKVGAFQAPEKIVWLIVCLQVFF